MGLKDLLFGKKKEELEEVSEPAASGDAAVKLYTLPTCGYCKQMRRHLTRNNIEFEDINLKEDKDGQQFMKDRGYTGVPVVIIKGNEIVGFDLDKVNELLGIS